MPVLAPTPGMIPLAPGLMPDVMDRRVGHFPFHRCSYRASAPITDCGHPRLSQNAVSESAQQMTAPHTVGGEQASALAPRFRYPGAPDTSSAHASRPPGVDANTHEPLGATAWTLTPYPTNKSARNKTNDPTAGGIPRNAPYSPQAT